MEEIQTETQVETPAAAAEQPPEISERDRRKINRFMERLAFAPRKMETSEDGTIARDGDGGAAYVRTNKGIRRVVQLDDGEPVLVCAMSKQQRKELKRATRKAIKQQNREANRGLHNRAGSEERAPETAAAQDSSPDASVREIDPTGFARGMAAPSLVI